MPYFFEDKDTYENDTDDIHFIRQGYIDRMYVVLLDDYNMWKYNDISNDELNPMLFCGDMLRIITQEIRINYRNSIMDCPQEAELQRKTKIEQSNCFLEFARTPLRRYSQIISIIRSSEYFKEIDFTNYNSVKELFMRYNIFTFDVFSKQNEYEFCPGHRMPFILSNGINVVGFGYKKDQNYYYDKKRKEMENRIFNDSDDEDDEADE